MDFFTELINTNNWFGENLAHNLEFIPEEKLSWKPAPTAMSALEIVHHVAHGMSNMRAALAGGTFGEVAVAAPTNRAEAQALLRETVAAYSAWLGTITDADLQGELALPFGTFPRTICVSMEVQDMIHHHGQIAYIQTLLGDTEDHYINM